MGINTPTIVESNFIDGYHKHALFSQSSDTRNLQQKTFHTSFCTVSSFLVFAALNNNR